MLLALLLGAILCSSAIAAEEKPKTAGPSYGQPPEIAADLYRAWDTPRRCYWGLAGLQPELRPSVGAFIGPYPYVSVMEWLADADVVLIGEQHDDPATHRLELELANTLMWLHDGAYGGPALALEMFERDVQPVLDRYAAEQLSEAELLAQARPWSNYRSDYRPLVEWLKLGDDAMLFASNAPTAISRRVAKEGLEAVLPTLTAEERDWIAETTTAPKDEYWRRFLEAMGGGASADAHSSGMREETLYRYYQAQCLKDDTMAETIARLREADPQRQVVHLSGSFHIDYGLGIVPRLRERRPQDKIVTVAIRPVADFEEQTLKAALDAEPGVADYVVFVLKEERTTPGS
jgi:uncharacterized iron-regulated protein